MTEENPPDPAEEARAREAVARYQDKLQERVLAIETQFDAALLLVAGGAFTVSAAIVSSFDSPLDSPSWLAWSWVFWSVCLIFSLSGHLVTAHAHKRVLQLIDQGEYDLEILLGGWAAKSIPWINGVTFALLVVGFMAFGKFTYDNLDFGREHDKEEVSEESPQEETGDVRQDRVQHSLLQESWTEEFACFKRAETGIGMAKTTETAALGEP